MTENYRTPGREEAAVGCGILGLSVADWAIGMSPEASVTAGLLFIGWGFWKGR